MFHKIKIAALSAVLGLGTLAAAPATAQADSFYFGITSQGPRAGVIVDEGRSYRHRDRWDRGHRWGRPGRWDRGDRWGRRDRGCSAREALFKADRMGVHRAYVRGENRNTIRIGGRSRGHRVTVVFAKAPRCPVIG